MKKFVQQNLNEMVFDGQDLKNALFDRCNIIKCSFKNAIVTDATFDRCNCIECDFTDCNIDEANFIKSNIITHEDVLEQEKRKNEIEKEQGEKTEE